MGLDGPSFYDDDGIFANYSERRKRPDSPNHTLELPVVADLLGDPTGHDFLDLGCGDGQFGRDLLAAGANSYFGIGGSQNMVAAAITRLEGTSGIVERGRLEDLALPSQRFSRVSARLVLHYLADVTGLFHEVRRTLKAGGLFVFSVEHPVITSSSLAATASGLRQNWVVDDYFNTGPRTTQWMGGDVVKHHRTIEDYFATIQSAGLQVESLSEAKPRAEHFTNEDLFRRRCRIPLFLVIAARKPVQADA
jgi:SAM-dependent methyltransferase